MNTKLNQAALLKELDLLKAECPRTHAALDRPMAAHGSMLAYRTAQADALLDASAKLERNNKRLVAALKKVVSMFGERTGENAQGYVAADHPVVAARVLLAELGEAA